MHPNDPQTPDKAPETEATVLPSVQASSQESEPSNQASSSEQDHGNLQQYMFIIYILFLLGMVTGLTTLVGVIMVYIKRDEMDHTVYADHATFLIRTFWIALVATGIGMVTAPLLIGLLILPLVFVWYTYRSILGFIRFNDRKPIDPLTWW